MQNTVYDSIKTSGRKHNSGVALSPGAEIDPAMERTSREMVKLCEGIPGAIIALAKQLAGKGTVSEWEIVQKNARPYLSQVMASCRIIRNYVFETWAILEKIQR